MKVSVRALSLLSCAVLMAGTVQTTLAQVTSATVYLHTPDPGNAGDPANEGATLASANFSLTGLGINFETAAGQSSDTTTIGTFLNNPTFTNPVNGFSSSTLTDNSELVITGNIFLNSGNNSFVVGHDDGVVLTIPGISYVLNDPGPTGFTNTPFTVSNPGTAGSFAFTLDYAECCGGPADLEFTINGAPVGGGVTPEPSSLTLMGTGLLAFAGMVRRRVLA